MTRGGDWNEANLSENPAVKHLELLGYRYVAPRTWMPSASRLEQLVGNLVSNAMAYGAPAEPVTVTSKVSADSFMVAVHNSGPTIPLAAQAGLFLPMARGANATSSGRSIGLGLFIVSEIAKAHGGSALVKSALDEGTTFSVVIPRG